MPYIKKEFKRKAGDRDARLFVIASEGQKTEPKYFTELFSQKNLNNPRVHIEVLKRNTSFSSPEHVLKELSKFKSKYRLNRNDELWMVIDLDRWGDRKLSSVTKECIQKNHKFAISNPCFEVWLLLHILDVEKKYSKSKLNSFICADLKKQIVDILGSYNPSNLDTSHFVNSWKFAKSRAMKLDLNPQSRWPNSFGTHIYKLINEIMGIEDFNITLE